VATALERERREQRQVLFPVRVDDDALDSADAVVKELRRTRDIEDMSRWKDHDSYVLAFERLLWNLRGEDPDEKPPEPTEDQAVAIGWW